MPERAPDPSLAQLARRKEAAHLHRALPLAAAATVARPATLPAVERRLRRRRRGGGEQRLCMHRVAPDPLGLYSVRGRNPCAPPGGGKGGRDAHFHPGAPSALHLGTVVLVQELRGKPLSLVLLLCDSGGRPVLLHVHPPTKEGARGLPLESLRSPSRSPLHPPGRSGGLAPRVASRRWRRPAAHRTRVLRAFKPRLFAIPRAPPLPGPGPCPRRVTCARIPHSHPTHLGTALLQAHPTPNSAHAPWPCGSVTPTVEVSEKKGRVSKHYGH